MGQSPSWLAGVVARSSWCLCNIVELQVASCFLVTGGPLRDVELLAASWSLVESVNVGHGPISFLPGHCVVPKLAGAL